MQKGQVEIQKGLKETNQEMQKGQQGMEKGVENVQKCHVEEKIALKVEEKIAVVEEIIVVVEEKIVVVEEKIVKKEKLLPGGNENKNQRIPLPALPKPVLASPVPVTAFTWPVELSTYDGKAKWEVYKTQLSIISEGNGWTEGVKACQLAASIRGEAAKILHILPDTERPNLKPLYNALNLRFGKKYSKDYTRLQMKTRLQRKLEKVCRSMPLKQKGSSTWFSPTTQQLCKK
ncbi:uncharacterized protein TNCV_1964811 [Trichonephila clavipes]|nr:uncharacterized protein TNCV_1964811 [Trichonephila clavipes]